MCAIIMLLIKPPTGFGYSGYVSQFVLVIMRLSGLYSLVAIGALHCRLGSRKDIWHVKTFSAISKHSALGYQA